MKQDLKILFTFDYELFLGQKSGTVQNCMIIPTNEILAVLKKYNQKGIFFIDATYLLRLKEIIHLEPVRKDWDEIETQLSEVLKNGHQVYLHVHPHWLDAVYSPETNQWDLSETAKFSFASLDEESRRNLFKAAYRLLDDLVKKYTPAHKIEGYRAGGLCIQPFTAFRQCFLDTGIKYEFSVLPGAFLDKGTYGFDFRAGIEKDIYAFDDDVLKENAAGKFKEFTMPQLSMPFFIRIMNSLWYRAFHRGLKIHSRWGDGLSTSPKIKSTDAGKTGGNSETMSVESLTMPKVFAYTGYAKRSGYMHFISHPKLISEGSVRSLDFLLRSLSRRYTLDNDFKNWK